MSEQVSTNQSASPTTADTANAKPVVQDSGNAKNATNGSNPDASAVATANANAKEAERKFKLKFGKQEKELTEKELIAHAQKGWAADEKFQTAAQRAKEVDAFLERMKTDEDAFDEFVKFLGKDPDEVYKKQLGKSLKKKIMTPEQRELEELREKVRKSEEQEKKAKEAEHAKRVEELQSKYEQQYDQEMSDAISKSGLPKTPKTVKRVAEIMYKSLKNGFDLPWEIAIDQVRSEYQTEMKELFGSAEAESLIKIFGEDVAKKMATASLQKRTVDPEPVREENRQPSKAKDPEPQTKYISEDEFEERMRKFKNS